MKTRIYFIAPPFSGHVNPLIELALPLLTNNKYEIKFITGPEKIPMLHKLGFSAISILKDRPNAMELIANSNNPIKNNPFLLFKQLQANLAILPIIKKELKSIFDERKPDIVIADFVAVPAGIICEELDIPWITTIPTPFAIETTKGTPSYLGGLNYPNNILGHYRDYIGRNIVHIFKKIIGLACKKQFDILNFKIYRKDGTEMAYSKHSILGLGMKEFEFKRDWPKNFRLIGPCCLSPEQEIKLNINFKKHKKYVLVSLGTHLEWAKADLMQNVISLANSFKHIVFIISYGRSKNITAYPLYNQDNVQAYEYIPYNQYLKFFDVIIHHGGAGITYNCIKHCKPSIVIPHDYDQFDFASRIEHANIGIKVKNINSIETINSLNYFLSKYKRQPLLQLSEKLKKYHPAKSLEKEIKRLLLAKI